MIMYLRYVRCLNYSFKGKKFGLIDCLVILKFMKSYSFIVKD